MPDLAGTVLQDSYKIEHLIGKGGMGAVYAVSHLRLARRFAVKVLYPSKDDASSEMFERFRQEAEVTSALGHPHIVEVIDFNFTPQGAPYILMEYLEGEDLSRRIKQRGALGLAATASIFRQAASALRAAHKRGVVHRDLKPQNVFLCRREERDDFVKLVDFGISKILGSPSSLTQTSSLMGTPDYMAPEQVVEGAATVDVRTDIYATGAIVYEMFAGRPPLTASSIPALLYKVVHEEPSPLRSIRPDLPEALAAVIATAMHKEREARFASIADFSAAFAEAIGEGDVDPSSAAKEGTDGRAEAPDQRWAEVAQPISGLEHTLAAPGSGRDGPPRATTGEPRAATGEPGAAAEERSSTAAATSAAADQPGQVTTLSASTGQLALPQPHGRFRGWLFVLGGVAVIAASALATVFVISPRQAAVPPSRDAGAGRASPSPALDARAAVAVADRPDAAAVVGPAPEAAVASRATVDATANDAAMASRATVDATANDAAARPGRRIWIGTRRPGARVYLGKRLLGKTPLIGVRLPPGDHALMIRRRGYARQVVRVKASDGPRIVHEVRLRHRRGARGGAEPEAPMPSSTKPDPRSTKTKKGWIIRPKIE